MEYRMDIIEKVCYFKFEFNLYCLLIPNIEGHTALRVRNKTLNLKFNHFYYS